MSGPRRGRPGPRGRPQRWQWVLTAAVAFGPVAGGIASHILADLVNQNLGAVTWAVAGAAVRRWAELQKPGKTVAVMDMAWLLPKDGLLDRLKAHGATVGEPPQLASAAKPEGDSEKD